eukprot:scaffold10690_cov126-Cylindrotheca_fusiformis.AAC.1
MQCLQINSQSSHFYTSKGMSDFGNKRKEENSFSEPAAPSGLNANESNFNEIEVKELASKVSEIALDEREAALFDMHGVAPTLDEDPERLSTSMQEMNRFLTNMVCWKQASAFKLAESQSPEYTRNENLLLMFLRCESFNAKKAATRMIAFFRHKLSLFGPEKLCKGTIGQNDLDDEDLKRLRAGCLQLLPRRDHAGRAQLIYFRRFSHWATHDNALRLIYYWCMAALRDEETQKKGVVLIVHSVGNDESTPKERDTLLAWKGMQLLRGALPIKVVGHHICSSPTSGLRFYFSYVAKFFDSAGIARTRFHEGTFEEVDQQLAGFGISGVDLVISYEGELKVDKHKEMIRTLKCLEAQTLPVEHYVILPSHTDVLLGRGKPSQNHPGNLRLSLIAESLLQNCDGSGKLQGRTQLAAETVERMKRVGVRFLTKCDEGWKIAPDRLARERVSSTFRTVRDRLKMQDIALLDSGLANADIHTKRNKRMLE